MNRRIFLTIIALSLVCGAIFINNESFWIDEGHTYYKSTRDSLASWYQNMVTDGGSDALMPGYMLLVWGWVKMTGFSEFALRASNLIWLFVAAFSLRRTRLGWLCLLLSPFLLYYVNELRPYAMQVAGGAICIAGILELENRSARRGWLLTLLGVLLLSASSLTGVFWAGGAILYLLIIQPDLLKNRQFLKDFSLCAILLLLLAVHYVRSVMLGKGPSPIGGNIGVSLGATLYELVGLLGLGPGRNELRENPASILRFALPVLGGALVMGTAIALGGWNWLSHQPRRRLIAAALALATPMGVLILLIYFKDFRLLGRHLAPIVPLFSLCIARCITPANFRSMGKSIRVIGILAIITGFISALELRFATRHRKDDYRQAASQAKDAIARGQKVVWGADPYLAEIYGLPGKLDRPETWFYWEPSENGFPLAGTEKVFFSKPDISDPRGLLINQLADKGFSVIGEFPAFKVYQATPQSPAPTAQ